TSPGPNTWQWESQAPSGSVMSGFFGLVCGGRLGEIIFMVLIGLSFNGVGGGGCGQAEDDEACDRQACNTRKDCYRVEGVDGSRPADKQSGDDERAALAPGHRSN